MKTTFFALLLISPAVFGASIPLKPQPGFQLLSTSCGPLNTNTYVTAFNNDGTISGEVYAWMHCGSGRYGSRQYQSWHSIHWDLAGNALATVPYDNVTPNLQINATYAGYRAYVAQSGLPGSFTYQAMLITP
ncbi:MAG: hypothetical protein JWN43_2082 [Gammaproteobacteria bacterium]|nr:hypothetical protein [Gammaproteobacteria bacterium]